MMSVRKLHDISEATMPVLPPLRAENLRVAFELSVTAMRLKPSPRLRGVRRYASVEEAWEQGDTDR
jgi:hypothetical protein